ncbi:hypothetical protein RND81_06G015500 [Saponaria officinalis]|uniref:U-box domain-containing protein n=1 Tax=Saponaria officinalis TaxID=3572 RepID=A0AAW1K5M6_SAPOF
MMKEIKISSTTPQFFTCPISLELFNDPVTLCTGQTYDRFCIEKWFAAGNLTCPVTMQKLHDFSFVPNHTLNQLIHQWRINHDYDHDYHDYYDCYVSLSTFKHVLQSKDCSFEQKIEVLEKLGILSDDLCRKNGLIEMGFLSILMGLIFGEEISEEMMEFVEKSIDFALKLIPFCCMNDLNLLIEDSMFENFKKLFKNGNFMVQIKLCNLIELIFTSLSSPSSSSNSTLAKKIANDIELIQTLIRLLLDYRHNYDVSKASIKAILTIISSSNESSYRENMVKQGLIEALVKYISEIEGKETKSEQNATKALEIMLELESARRAFLTNGVKSGLKALVKMVFRVLGDDECSESAVNCLMTLCYVSEEVREEAISGGVLTQLLLLLQSQCSGRVKTRARVLLKLLRTMWVKDPIHV